MAQPAAPSWTARCIHSPWKLRGNSTLRSEEAGRFKPGAGSVPKWPKPLRCSHEGGAYRADSWDFEQPLCLRTGTLLDPPGVTLFRAIVAIGGSGRHWAVYNPAAWRVHPPQSGEWKVQPAAARSGQGSGPCPSLLPLAGRRLVAEGGGPLRARGGGDMAELETRELGTLVSAAQRVLFAFL